MNSGKSIMIQLYLKKNHPNLGVLSLIKKSGGLIKMEDYCSLYIFLMEVYLNFEVLEV